MKTVDCACERKVKPTNTDWSDHVQGISTLYLSRKLRFDNFFSAQYRALFAIDADRPIRILEIGCGPGALAGALHRWYPLASITGIDRDSAFIDFARRNEPGVEFLEGDATALPFGDEMFDVTISYTVSEHIAPTAFFGEQHRVLKHGGICLVLSARKGYNIAAECLADSGFETAFWEKTAPFDDSMEKYAVCRYPMSEAELPAAMAMHGFRNVTTGYAVADLTPDDPKYSPEMALAMIEANRQGDLESILSARRDLAPHLSAGEFDEMTRLINRKYDRRVTLYQRGEKQWDTNVSIVMAVRGVK